MAAGLPPDFEATVQRIIEFVLDDDTPVGNVYEASVHLPKRGRVWIATYTGASGGQVWRSTGLTNRRQALLVARRWESQARAQRERRGRTPGKAVVRAGQGIGYSQEEVALAMKLSVRAVRQIEKRAVKKLLADPGLRQAWHAYLSGQLDEQESALTPEEIEALFGLVRTNQERIVLQGILHRLQP